MCFLTQYSKINEPYLKFGSEQTEARSSLVLTHVNPVWPLCTPRLLRRGLQMADVCSVLSGWCLNGHGCVRKNRTELFLTLIWGQLYCYYVLFFVWVRFGKLTPDCMAKDNIYPECVCDAAKHLVIGIVLCYFLSKQQRVSVSSEDTESGRSSPDPQPHSPKHQHNRRSE